MQHYVWSETSKCWSIQNTEQKSLEDNADDLLIGGRVQLNTNGDKHYDINKKFNLILMKTRRGLTQVRS